MSSILSTLKNRSILILGLGREGISTYTFLRNHFPEKKLALADAQPLEKLNTKLISLLHKDNNVVLQLEEKHLNYLSTSDVIFKSPGIPASLPDIQQAIAHGTLLSSNTQLFFDLLEEKIKNQNTNHEQLTTNSTIGITGTKGKSTTAALIHNILKENDLDTVLLGNIGTPPLDKIDEIHPKTVIVVELSCHQLAELTHSPHIAVVQEITSEHLDYYPTTEAYVEAKSAICRYQNKNDIVIYNEDYPKTKEVAQLSPGKHITQNTFISENKDNSLLENYPNLPGQHNQSNIIPAIIVGQLFDLNSDQIRHSIASFQPLPHRLQLVARIDGIRYYNDSLSTTPEATIAALNAFENTPIVLLAGGYERHQNFSELAKAILRIREGGSKENQTNNQSTKVKTLILFPTTGQRLWDEIEKQYKEQNPEITNGDKTPELPLTPSLPAAHFVETMSEAVEIAKKHAEPGDIVLLSPASASFNSFKDYADRGEQFEKEITK